MNRYHRSPDHLNVSLKGVAVALASVLVAATGWAATIPYSEDFEDGTADGFTSSGTWAVGNNTTFGNNAYTNTNTGSTAASSYIEFTNLYDSNLFQASYDFVVDSRSGTVASSTVDMGWYLGSTSGVDSPVYLLDFQVYGNTDGRMRIVELGGDVLETSTYTLNGGGALSTGVQYSSTIIGSLDAGVLTLTLNLSDGVTTNTLVAVDATPQLGGFIGFRNRTAGEAASTISFDNFNVVVPEPGTFAMVLGGIGVLVGFQRRRA